MKIYLGPWTKINKHYKKEGYSFILAYIRPVLTPKYAFCKILGCETTLGEPEIFLNEFDGRYYSSLADNDPGSDTLEEEMKKNDQGMSSIGYYGIDAKVVFLSQEKFEKLMVLK